MGDTVKRALISVSDKTGLVEFSRGLHKLGIELISTGGTAELLAKEKIPAKSVSDVTGYPEMLDGRVKTLHPVIHGALLALRDREDHLQQLDELGIAPIDLVVVNLYPFRKTILGENVALDEVLENIDIGGVSLIRSAAKNYKHIAVSTDPQQYQPILDELIKNKNQLILKTKESLAVRAFRHVVEYDAVICQYLQNKLKTPKEDFPETIILAYEKAQSLRYGENPHQRAAFYREFDAPKNSITNAKQIHGKELSFNNILDLNDALEIVREFEKPAAAIIKHTSPCGVATGKNTRDAYKRAYATDPMSAFGCVVSLNRAVDAETASEIKSTFVEAVVAPEFSVGAVEILKQKKNIQLLDVGELSGRLAEEGMDLKKVVGGLLIQDRDLRGLQPSDIKVASSKKPTDGELREMFFAWTIVKHVKSNAIVFTKDECTVGIGAGQMSRVDAVKIAAMKSGEKAKGSVMASDAFFPFRDGVDEAARAGVSAIIQPGGSIRDREVIDAVNEHGLSMVFTGVRCFKH